MSKLLIFRKAITKDSSRSSDTGDNVDFLAVPASNIANMSATLGEVVLTLKDGNDFSDQALSNSSSTTLTFCNVVFTVTEGTELNVVNSIWKSIYGDSDVVYFDGVNSVFPIQEILSIKSIIRTTPPTFTSSGGSSLPSGGVATQVLTKQSATDGDAAWEYTNTLYVLVRNTSGSDLDKGTPVHATGVTGDVADVIVADASSAAAMPATYILNENILNNEQGVAIISGVIENVDTSSFSPGDVVYVASGGGFTNVKPTGTNLIQNLGVVTKSNASTGSGVVYGAGRSNDVPNLPTGKFFIGSASNTTESAYTLPTADGSANQVLTTNGAGAVSFQTPAKAKWSMSFSKRYYLYNATSFHFGDATYGHTDVSPVTYIASTSSCTFVDVYNGGIPIPYSMENLGFEVVLWSSGNSRTINAYLLSGTSPAADSAKTTSISLTTQASDTSVSMASTSNMYKLSASGSGSVSAGDFLLFGLVGSSSSYYYATVTIYGDIV